MTTVQTAGRLLIVDDEPTNIEVLVDLLENDFDVLVATDGAQALHLARTAKPDLVLLDVLMPGMDGYQTCAALKADAATRDIPVIFITGLGDPAAETRGLEAGAVDYIAKPFSPAVVETRVRVHLELKAARDKLARLAATDGLTGIANRRHFDRVLEVEGRRLHRSSEARLSLILVDIDHFKDFNDTYGHVAGDDCLRRVARTIEGLVARAPDVAARYGGEEFACLLPETDRDGAMALAELIRAGIEELRIPHVASSVAPHVTASLGVATVTPKTQGFIDDIVRRADKQLYRAKLAGRNCVMAADQEDACGPALGIPGIDMGAGLARVRHNTKLYRALLSSFYERNRTLAKDLWALVEAGDRDRLRYLTHNVRGVAANLGAGDLARAAGSLEGAVAPTGFADQSEVVAALHRFESRLADVLGGLDSYLEATAEPFVEFHGNIERANDLDEVRWALAEALAALDHDLGRALDLISGVEGRLMRSAVRDDCRQLQYHLAEFDTDNARATLAGMLLSLGRALGETPAGAAAGPSAGDRPRILIVDDAPENLLILVEALKDQYAISATRNATQALLLAASEPQPDLILLNIVLPGIDGYQVLRRLRENPATQDLPVIFLTGLESVENEALGLSMGAVDYIRKPITYPVLELRLKLHLALIHSRRRLEEQNQQLLTTAKQREDVDRIIQHDLKAPLHMIVSASNYLLGAYTFPKDVRELIGHIERAGHEMNNFITTSIDILKLESKSVAVEKSRGNLVGFAHQVAEDLAPQAAAAGVAVTVEVEGRDGGNGAIVAEVERVLFRAMLRNLLKNAIEAAPRGSTVTVRLAATAGRVTIAVHNHGMVPPEVRDRFFEKYATHGKHGGTGLGTYAARLIAQAHGGGIDFETAEDTGTTVRVWLPRD